MTAKEYWNLQTQHDELVKVFREMDEANFRDGSVSDEELFKVMDELSEMNSQMFELACSLGAKFPDVVKNEWDKLDGREERINEMLNMRKYPQGNIPDFTSVWSRLKRTEHGCRLPFSIV